MMLVCAAIVRMDEVHDVLQSTASALSFLSGLASMWVLFVRAVVAAHRARQGFAPRSAYFRRAGISPNESR